MEVGDRVQMKRGAYSDFAMRTEHPSPWVCRGATASVDATWKRFSGLRAVFVRSSCLFLAWGAGELELGSGDGLVLVASATRGPIPPWNVSVRSCQRPPSVPAPVMLLTSDFLTIPLA